MCSSPAQLLVRRPDVAAAEQNVVAANAQIGVARAQLYPTFNLTSFAGFESTDISNLLNWQSAVAAIAPSVSATIFEGGRLKANVKAAEAVYRETVAAYINQVLVAYGDVEDALVDLHAFSDEVMSLREAVTALGRPDLKLAITEDWHMQPEFLQAVADRVREALDALPAERRDATPVLLSAHSMPLRVVADEPDYIDNLKQTAQAIAERADVRPEQWMFCYQSAGHTPEPWLKPDFADLMPELKAKGASDVLIAPVQFLADHLEILYDIEVGAREQAEEHGITFHRTQSLNAMPLFIAALASVVEETLLRAAPLEPAPAAH